MNKIRHICKNSRGIAPVIETMTVVSICITILALFFVSVSSFYNTYDRTDVDLQAKSLDICETLITSPGQSYDNNPNWEDNPENVSILGLGTCKLAGYGILDYYDDQFYPLYSYGSINLMGLTEACFLPGTKVLMFDGTYKNIEDVKIGDIVKSFDEGKYRLENSRVTNIYHHTPKEMTDYYLVLNNYLKVTPNHMLYHNDKWITFDKVAEGDIIGNIRIYSIEKIFHRVSTYDLEIEKNHNYFVQIDKGPLLAHNEDNGVSLPEIDGLPWVLTSKDTYPENTFDFEPYGMDYYVQYTPNLDEEGYEWPPGQNDHVSYIYEIKGKNSFPYGVLDLQKIYALQSSGMSYSIAKSTLGIPLQYGFNITIRGESGMNFIFGEPYENSDFVSTTTRNIIIYHQPEIIMDGGIVTGATEPWYEDGYITVRVFLSSIHPNFPPYKPFDEQPRDKQDNVDIYADLRWKCGDHDGDPLTYDVYFGTSSEPPLVVSNQSDTIYDPGQMTIITTYYWKIIAWDKHGVSTKGPIWEFTTRVNNPPREPRNPSPGDGDEDVPLNTKLSVEVKDTDSDSLDVSFYWDDGAFIDVVTVVDCFPNWAIAETHNLQDLGIMLDKNTTYSWYAIANDSRQETSSNIFSFTTEINHDPYRPYAVNPEPGEVGVCIYPPNELVLVWGPLPPGVDPDGDDVLYDVYFDTEDPPQIVKIDHETAYYFMPDLDEIQENTTYYWKIVAHDNYGGSNESEVWNFTTVYNPDNNPPDKPELKVSGGVEGTVGEPKEFIATTKDLDFDLIYFNFSWGDGTSSGWMGPIWSGGSYKIQHTWYEPGIYVVQVQARDMWGAKSPWSDPVTVWIYRGKG